MSQKIRQALAHHERRAVAVQALGTDRPRDAPLGNGAGTGHGGLQPGRDQSNCGERGRGGRGHPDVFGPDFCRPGCIFCRAVVSMTSSDSHLDLSGPMSCARSLITAAVSQGGRDGLVPPRRCYAFVLWLCGHG